MNSAEANSWLKVAKLGKKSEKSDVSGSFPDELVSMSVSESHDVVCTVPMACWPYAGLVSPLSRVR